MVEDEAGQKANQGDLHFRKKNKPGLLPGFFDLDAAV